MTQKTVKFNQDEISKLPNDKPAIYKILTPNGTNNYTGSAQRGRVRERIIEHLGEIPGAKVRIQQMKSIKDAREKEVRSIKRSQPKYNKQSK